MVEPRPSRSWQTCGADALQLNDCVADPEGRSDRRVVLLLARARSIHSASCSPSMRDGTVRVLDEGFHLANGLGWSPDRKTLLLCGLGRPHDLRLWLRCYQRPGSGSARAWCSSVGRRACPDGLTVDAEGFIWSAEWYGGCVCRYDPDGALERRIRSSREADVVARVRRARSARHLHHLRRQLRADAGDAARIRRDQWLFRRRPVPRELRDPGAAGIRSRVRPPTRRAILMS